jgi:hypothetical protein
MDDHKNVQRPLKGVSIKLVQEEGKHARHAALFSTGKQLATYKKLPSLILWYMMRNTINLIIYHRSRRFLIKNALYFVFLLAKNFITILVG